MKIRDKIIKFLEEKMFLFLEFLAYYTEDDDSGYINPKTNKPFRRKKK